MRDYTYDPTAYHADNFERSKLAGPGGNLAEALDELFLRLHAIDMAVSHGAIENQDDSAALSRMVLGAKNHLRSVDAALGLHALKPYFPCA